MNIKKSHTAANLNYDTACLGHLLQKNKLIRRFAEMLRISPPSHLRSNTGNDKQFYRGHSPLPQIDIAGCDRLPQLISRGVARSHKKSRLRFFISSLNTPSIQIPWPDPLFLTKIQQNFHPVKGINKMKNHIGTIIWEESYLLQSIDYFIRP
jgi:hypothetical protein